MAVSLVINSVTYAYPQTGDLAWGDQAQLWASAVTAGMLQKAGGSFTLTGDVNFGANFGLISKYFTSITASASATGALRLASTDTVSWRNNANSADIALSKTAGDLLQYNAITLADISSAQTLTNKTISGSSNTLSNIAYASLVLSGLVVNADISNSAAIAYSKLALTGAILNADLAGSIAYSKLSLTGAILNADLAGSIANAKLATMAANTVKANITGSTAVPTDVAMVSAATATAAMIRDANANVSVNNLLEGFQTITTAAGTTTLTVGSPYVSQFTGATTQIVVLPVVATLVLGQAFMITNRSSGVVTVNSSGGNLVQTMASGSQLIVTCALITGTTAASWDASFSNASATGTVTSVTFTGDGTVLSSTPSSAVTSSGTVTATIKNQNAGTFLAGPTSGSAANPTFRALQVPTVQKFTTSSGTYTTPAGVLYLRVKLVGAGGGGGNSGAGASGSGTTGGNTTFGTSLLTGNGGVGGAAAASTAGATGGAGGTATVTTSGTVIQIVAVQGGAGGGSAGTSTGAGAGGAGGSSPYGGAPAGGVDAANGISAVANTGSGATGAGGGNALAGAGGGGSGGYLEALLTSPSATYAYAIGAGGTASGGGGFAGGTGGSGFIEVTEYYQ